MEPALTIVPSEDDAAHVANRDAALLHWMQQLAPHGIFTTDNELRIETWNHWLESHSGLPTEAVVGKSLLEMFPELVTRKVADQFRRALEGQVSVLSTALHGYLLPFPSTMKDRGFPLMQQTARIGPLLLNRTVCGTITTIEDVTQREVQARITREYAEDLENKVRERTAKLDETVAQLESFSYTLAHDLRAPIRTFKGYSEILLEDYGGEFPEKAREYVERMKRAANGMDLLTRDLLQFSRISRQPVTSEPINVEEVLDEIVSHMPGLQSPGVLTVHKPLHTVVGNRTMVQQCLSNLLDNALKFVVPNHPARICIRSEPRDAAAAGEIPSAAPLPFISAVPEVEAEKASDPTLISRRNLKVRIFVQDRGIGISAEHHKKIFGIFERIQGPQKYEGTGIGLAIVARAAQRMNGSCGVESLPEGGSRFWLELPGV